MKIRLVLLCSTFAVPALAQSSGIPWRNGDVLTANALQSLDAAKMNLSSLGLPGFAAKLDALGRVTAPVVGDVSQAVATPAGDTVSSIAEIAKAAQATANGVAQESTKFAVAIDGKLSSPSVVGPNPSLDFLTSGGELNSNRIRLSTTPTQFTISLASDDGTSTVPLLTCSRSGMVATGCAFSSAVKTPGITLDRPIAGDLKGTGSINYIKPDPMLSGSVKVTNSIQPSVSIRSVLSGYVDKWWQDSNGSYFSTNGNPAPYKMYLNGLDLYGNSTSFTFSIYNSSGENPLSSWVDSSGNGFSQAHGGDYTFYAGEGHSVISGSPFQFNSSMTAPYLPKKNPGSGAHFVCVDDSGDMYRSDTACN